MARSEFTDLKGPLSRALKQVASRGRAAALDPVWAEAVGPALSRQSRPLLLEDGRLTVEVDAHLLSSVEAEKILLIERLNARLGKSAVRQIVLQAR